jgi:hypothetical protein
MSNRSGSSVQPSDMHQKAGMGIRNWNGDEGVTAASHRKNVLVRV